MLLRTSSRRFASTLSPSRGNDFTHCIIGGGVVGLAIASKLSQRPGTSTILLERHPIIGSETSARNSEVIHAGLYYPVNSLKTKLCIRGSDLLYDLCARRSIPHRRTGKWILAQDPLQLETLQAIHEHASSLGVPTVFLSSAEIEERELDVKARGGVLESPRTGIVDSHALMTFLHGSIEANGGDVAVNTPVTSISKIPSGYSITALTPGEPTTITADILVNAAGHGAVQISNLLLPQDRHLNAYYCKGTYFSYTASFPAPKTLLYPAPIKGAGGLGTHLTLDMAGRIRFGPDVEWVESETDLVPSAERLQEAVVEIKKYLPGVREEALAPDYCGVRPKIVDRGAVGSVDFVIRKEEGFDGFVNLLGIESPGLTSSLAIAEMVEELLYK
ncbi:Vacuolar protein sorting-associated protein 52 [Rhizina undulata]